MSVLDTAAFVPYPVTPQDIAAAAARIAGRVRRTPMLHAGPVRTHATAGRLWLKLENLQVTGSFKARGASNAVAALSPSVLARGVVTASGGNHGLAVAAAAAAARVPATIFLPGSVPASKRARFAAWGATTIVHGQVWDDAYAAAEAHAAQSGQALLHPFADPLVIAGQGTVALEIFDDQPGTETILVAIGGGGLMSGVALAARGRRPGAKLVGVEPTGAATLHSSLAAGRPVVLDGIHTAAGTLAPRSTHALNFRIIQALVDHIVLVTDDEMRDAARWLWAEHGLATELAGAASVAAVLTGRYVPGPDEVVCAIVCGAGTDGF